MLPSITKTSSAKLSHANTHIALMRGIATVKEKLTPYFARFLLYVCELSSECAFRDSHSARSVLGVGGR